MTGYLHRPGPPHVTPPYGSTPQNGPHWHDCWQGHHECALQYWWHKVARIEIHTYPTRADARTAELQMIIDEQPRYNKSVDL